MSGLSITISESGRVSITDAAGNPVSLAEYEGRLRRVAAAARDAGADPADVQAVTLFAGLVRAQARMVGQVGVLRKLAVARAKADEALDLTNMRRGVPQRLVNEIKAWWREHRAEYPSENAAREACAIALGTKPSRVRTVIETR